MRMPHPKEFDQGDGNGVDYEAYEEAMGDYEDAERDKELDEFFEKEEEKERKAG